MPLQLRKSNFYSLIVLGLLTLVGCNYSPIESPTPSTTGIIPFTSTRSFIPASTSTFTLTPPPTASSTNTPTLIPWTPRRPLANISGFLGARKSGGEGYSYNYSVFIQLNQEKSLRELPVLSSEMEWILDKSVVETKGRGCTSFYDMYTKDKGFRQAMCVKKMHRQDSKNLIVNIQQAYYSAYTRL